MSRGIPFGLGFGGVPIPNADPDEMRRLVRRLPFDPAQAPAPENAADMNGPAGALVHHPGWTATGTDTNAGNRYPGLLEDRPQGITSLPPDFGSLASPTAPAVTGPQFDQRFNTSPPGEGYGLTASAGEALRAGLDTQRGGAPMRQAPLPPERPLDLSPDAPAAGKPPTRYTGLGLGDAPPAPPAAGSGTRVLPGALAVPQPPAGAGNGSAVPSPQGLAANAAAGAAAEPSFGDKLSSGVGRFFDNGGGDLLGSLGIGLMSTPGFGAGLAAGLKNYQTVSEKKATTDLVRQELGLKLKKAMQEAAGQNATLQYLTGKGVPLADAQGAIAASVAGRPEALQNLLNNAVPKDKDPAAVTVGGTKHWLKPGETPTESNTIGPAEADKEQWQLVDVPLAGGQTQKQWVKKGEPTGTAVGQPAPPDKPQGFEVESKLRGEFAKGLGTFSDVHDGYGRVIAATRQREANPSTVSPASDIGLIFGYMKMLDSGSVVREGEYATAANAAGIPERVANAYNKALKGEFLTPEQRQDFIGQASELYGTARKNAEAVAGRYRNLAGQYGVDPDRSVFLPEAPPAPMVGPSRTRPAQGQGGAPLDVGGSRDMGGGVTIRRVR